MLLESGTFFRLDRPELHRLRDLIEEARDIADPETGGLRLSAHHADLWDELVALGVVDEQSARWAANVEALGSLESGPLAEVPPGLQATLRPYQLDGFRWLAFLWDARSAASSPTTWASARRSRSSRPSCARTTAASSATRTPGPFLVVAPTSVVGTGWASSRPFAPHLRAVAVTATERKRGRVARRDRRRAPRSSSPRTPCSASTTPPSTSVRWGGVVLDEAQFVKNHQAKTYQACAGSARRSPSPITGTPLENTLMDLWSLLSITAPGLFPRPDVFTKNYRKPDRARRATRAARPAAPADPAAHAAAHQGAGRDRPAAQAGAGAWPLDPHPVHRADLRPHLQRERQRVLGLLDDLDGQPVRDLPVADPAAPARASTPSLVDEAYAGTATVGQDRRPRRPARASSPPRATGRWSSASSPASCASSRPRSTRAGIAYATSTGRPATGRRVVRGFREGDAPVFLISLKAGGFGLNLTEADYVFVLDPWWNPAAEAQAVDRAHRIGQTRPVIVYRLVSATPSRRRSWR